jgi:penicillin-binding protein 1A
MLCGGALAAGLAVDWVVSVANSAPNLKDLTPQNPHPPSEIFASDGTSLGYITADTVFSFVSGKQIPKLLKDATVAIEDRRFFQHGALDYQGILRAGVKDMFGESNSLQGASTLTMQLVNNMYLDGTKYAEDHNLRYKITQAKLAEQLEKKHSKNWILDTYLNQVPYGTVGGETALGVGAASQMFFDTSPSQLDLAQMALLAGLPQSPSRFDPFLYPGPARARRHEVLQAMVQSHYITQGQANAANGRPLELSLGTQYQERQQPYIFDYVEQQLIDDLGLRTVEAGGLKVYSTINLQDEQDAQSAVDSHEGGAILDDQPAAGLASIDPSTGHILALASTAPYGNGPNQTTFDYATSAHRQPGSSFKVFALMTLIHDYDGDPNQTYYTSQFLPAGWLPQDPTWSVHTAEETYQGTINITKATIVSDNTVFAQLAADLGWHKLDEMAYAMGITTQLTANPSEVIGGLKIGVTPLEMADAYATLANGGTHIPATIIDKVVFPNGTVNTAVGNPHRTKVFTDGETAEAISVLKQVITSGTGTAANFGCPAAGKTGTANNLDNAWFVGFTPQLSTAVWVGYPQGNIPMSDGFGGTLAAPIWHDYTQAASDGYCGDWPAPADPWHGVAFTGTHSAGSGFQSGAGNSGNSGNTGNTGTSSPAPTIAAQPAQPAQPPAQTGGGAPPQANGGGGGGGGGTGNGNIPSGGGHSGGGGGKHP